VARGRARSAAVRAFRRGDQLGWKVVPEEIVARIADRRPNDDAAKLVDRIRHMLAANGCESAGGTIRCGPWIETVTGKATSAAALSTDGGPVLADPLAHEFERLEYRRPFLLPPPRS